MYNAYERNYEKNYEKIVKSNIAPKYQPPEEQGRSIRKCSILKKVEIEYSNTSRIGMKQRSGK